MKRRTRFAISIMSGVAAAAIAFLYASSVRTEAAEAEDEALARYGGDLVSVCVATRDIDPGETIDEENVSVVEWLSGMVPDDALTGLDDALGLTATSSIPENAVLSDIYFESSESAVEVPDGMAAVSVACDAEHAVGGVLEEDDRVYVYVSKSGVSDVLCEAQVLDTSVLVDDGDDLEWVTLAVDTASVEEVLAAATTGTITLVVPASGLELDAEADADEVDADEADAADADATGDAATEGGAADEAGDADGADVVEGADDGEDGEE